MKKVIELEEMRDGTTRAVFECPGCEMSHYPAIKNTDPGPLWSFNNDLEKPTLKPSVLVRWNEGDEKHICHSFVTDGRIRFLNDCTHELAGKTVDLKPIE